MGQLDGWGDVISAREACSIVTLEQVPNGRIGMEPKLASGAGSFVWRTRPTPTSYPRRANRMSKDARRLHLPDLVNDSTSESTSHSTGHPFYTLLLVLTAGSFLAAKKTSPPISCRRSEERARASFRLLNDSHCRPDKPDSPNGTPTANLRRAPGFFRRARKRGSFLAARSAR